MYSKFRKTKIICTVGPATDNDDVMRKLMQNGMNCARFNFSHGDYNEHRKRFEQIEKLRNELGLPIATMLDTKGPEVRTGLFKDGYAILKKGSKFTLTTEDVEGNSEICSVTYENLPKEVKTGSFILVDDGLISLEVTGTDDKNVYCKVLDGGMIKNRKGINVPNVTLAMPYLSQKDISDLQFGAEMKFDYIAASFVRTAADIDYLRNFTKSLGWQNVRIVAKVENGDAIKNIDEIIKAADGIMVARGDLGVEVPFEKIPSIQKKIIKKCADAGKHVITATQMLDSMINNPRPTRAEITDVANAVYDGTSAIMLSGETAAGKNPVEAVHVMDAIARAAESEIDYKHNFEVGSLDFERDITSAISHATVTTAHDLNASIITVTKSGITARSISKYRPESVIIGCTTSDVVFRQMNLSWGIVPVMCEEKNNTDELFNHAVEVSLANNLIEKGDAVVITAGVPLGQAGTTNMLKVQQIQ